MQPDRAQQLEIAEQAAEWVARLPNADLAQKRQFLRWLKQSPSHVAELLAAVHIDDALRNPSPVTNEDRSVAPISAGIADAQTARNRPLVRGWQIAASCAVLLLAVLLVTLTNIRRSTVQSDAGEWVSVTLDDGSKIQLGPRSQLRFEFDDRRRDIRLAKGEAWFEVATDEARPFIVYTDFATVRARGTSFAVEIIEAGIRVTVQHGSVVVAQDSPRRDVTISASEELHTSGEDSWVVHRVDVERRLAWVDRRLVFGVDSTLSDAVREFNRRNAQQLTLVDDSLGRLQIRGSFAADDPRAFAALLHDAHGLVVDEEDGVLRIAPQRNDHGAVQPRPTGR